MNTALWITQALLAAMIGMAGFMKATRPRLELVDNMAYVEDYSDNQIKAIGIIEVLAAFGLILPALTGIAPILTPLAAAGIIAVMIGAIVIHVRRSENQAIIMNLALLALAAFIAWGRFGDYAF